MNFTPFLVTLSAMVMAASSCNAPCRPVKQKRSLSFRHSTELQNTSVAPWSYRNSSEVGRLPETIVDAVCTTCSVENMVARSIYLQIWVYQRPHGHHGWCECPYELAVGCTCVKDNNPST